MVTRMMSSGVYAIPKIDFGVTPVVTNTTPTGPYRGAGRPEAASLVERAVDTMARALDDRPGRVAATQLPARFRVPVHDRHRHHLRQRRVRGRARRSAPHRRLRRAARRAARRGAPIPTRALLGIGVACYVETSGRGGEFGSVEVHDDGTVTVVTGSVPHGQGHETTWAQIASATLGVPFDAVRVVHSDTALVDHGVGTFGSRSTQLAGSAVREAAEVVLDQAAALAAELLEASPDDVVVLDDGRLGVAGVPASGRSWAELAAEATRRGDAARARARLRLGRVVPVRLPRGRRRDRPRDRWGRPCARSSRSTTAAWSSTRCSRRARCTAVSRRASRRSCTKACATTTTATRSPRRCSTTSCPAASDLPAFTTAHTVTPSPNNPLGAKGIGESGTTGSIAAVWNAVVDALAPFGVVDIDPPCTPEVVWRAMRRDEQCRRRLTSSLKNRDPGEAPRAGHRRRQSLRADLLPAG